METDRDSGHNGGVQTEKLTKHPPTMLAFLKKYYGRQPLVGVEIGVYGGRSALRTINTLNIRKFYLIDPYIKYDEYKNIYHTRKLKESKIAALQKIKAVATDEDLRFIYQKSQDAVLLIQESLDFVYIDGNHAYEYVKRDIELYYPKVRKNGVLGGHDYLDLPDNREEPVCVKNAVDEFAARHGYHVSVGIRDWPDWWITL